MQVSSPIVKQLVLVGGGHSHLSVLRHFGMNPLSGLAITLISRDIITPYSGSLPGFLTGIYDHDEIHIDLRPLAQFANARLIQEEVTDIDLDAKLIQLPGRPAIEFDILSLNIGSKPDAIKIPGADKYATGVKPIDHFIIAWESTRQEAITRLKKPGQEYTLVIVGGGPASVELAFASQCRVNAELGLAVDEPSPLKIKIISADAKVLSMHNQKVQDFATAELRDRGIELLLNHQVTRFKKKKIICDAGAEEGLEIAADAIFFATGASIPDWPAAAGLSIGNDGFIEVRQTLQTLSHDFVFATGDAATIHNEPRPKSGVYAVRQGKVLAQNLKRFATGNKLKNYFPQRKALALMSMGNGKAIASRGNFFMQGSSVWTMKHRIDRRFLHKFSSLPAMDVKLELAPGLVDKTTEQELRQHAMRCAGCGAKVASNILAEVLDELPGAHKEDIVVAPGNIEDTSIIRLEDNRLLLQTVDFLKAFVNDPWLFARIATNHCLSDIHAMGTQPHSALAIVGLPHASKRVGRSMLRDLMQGCSSVLAAEDCALVGGHSAESSELHFGLCINSFADSETLLRKDGMKQGDVLVLTKPLGTGTLLAADMRHQASHRWMETAFQQMLLSNLNASQCLIRHRANACTDITGFGLAGHLYEMMEANGAQVELDLSELPILPGALDTLDRGITSSLHGDNRLASEHIQVTTALDNPSRFEVLFDPQTAGGLLAAIPQEHAEACLQELKAAGYTVASAIGKVRQLNTPQAQIILKNHPSH